MSAPAIEFAHPVAWPAGRPRTPDCARKAAAWRSEGSRLNWDRALWRLREQINLVTPLRADWRIREQTLSTNFELRADGRPRRDCGRPADPAVAFFFELDGDPHVLACDKWDTIPDNIAAIAAHIEALRGQERWGVADLKQAFAGHTALPAPDRWWQILGVAAYATAAEVEQAWRQKMRDAHPDKPGGNAALAQHLNWAREESRKR